MGSSTTCSNSITVKKKEAESSTSMNLDGIFSWSLILCHLTVCTSCIRNCFAYLILFALVNTYKEKFLQDLFQLRLAKCSVHQKISRNLQGKLKILRVFFHIFCKSQPKLIFAWPSDGTVVQWFALDLTLNLDILTFMLPHQHIDYWCLNKIRVWV